MKVKILIFLRYVIFLFPVFSYGFDTDKYSPVLVQSVLAMEFDSTGTSYIYEESSVEPSHLNTTYKVVINNQEYQLPIEKDKNAVAQFGFAPFSKYYQTIYMMVSSENLLVLAYLPKKTDKNFIIKEFRPGSDHGSSSFDKPLFSNDKFLINSGNINKVYNIDIVTNEVKDLLKTSYDRKLVDFIDKDGVTYLLFIGAQTSNENTIYLSVYSKELSLIKEIQYSAENKVMDSRLLNKISNNISVVIQTFKKDSFPANLVSSIQMVNFSLSKSKAISLSYLFSSNIISNPKQLDNLIFCGADNSIYWAIQTEELRAKLAIKSTENDEYWVDLPKMSYVEKVFIGSNDKKIKVMVNFGKRMGKYFTQGFGSDELEVTCQ